MSPALAFKCIKDATDLSSWGHNFAVLGDGPDKTLTVQTGAGDYWIGIMDLSDAHKREQPECPYITARFREVASGGGQSMQTYNALAMYMMTAYGVEENEHGQMALPLPQAFEVERKDDETNATLRLSLRDTGDIEVVLDRPPFWDTIQYFGTMRFILSPATCPPFAYEKFLNLAYAMLQDKGLVSGAEGLRALCALTDRVPVNLWDRMKRDRDFEFSLPGY